MSDIRLWASSIVSVIAIVLVHVFYDKAGQRPSRQRLTWEFSLLFLPNFVVLPLVAAIGLSGATADTEWWGSQVVRASHYEDWNEYIYQICTRTVSCGKDCTTIETYDCSYVDYHPEYWELEDNIGQTIRISRERYQQIVQGFGGESFVDLHRHYDSNDGDKYVTLPNTKNKVIPVTVKRAYENRVAVAHSVFSYPEVPLESRALVFGYPELTDCLDRRCVLAQNTILDSQLWQANHDLSIWNAKLGPTKQARIWLLIFNGGTRELGLLQEQFWKGGNKNELVVCFGYSEGKVLWCHPFSWTERDDLKIEIRDYVEAQKWQELWEVANFIGQKTEENFERKHFHDFDYLSVPLPEGFIVVGWLLNMAVTGIVGYTILHRWER